MIIKSNSALALKVWMSPHAPVFVRHYKRGGRVALCRKPSCTIEQVEQFLLGHKKVLDEIL